MRPAQFPLTFSVLGSHGGSNDDKRLGRAHSRRRNVLNAGVFFLSYPTPTHPASWKCHGMASGTLANTNRFSHVSLVDTVETRAG